MFAPVPTLPTTVWRHLPDTLRLDAVQTAYSRLRGGGGLHSFLEGPAFDAQGNFWCVDLAHGRIFTITPEGQWQVFAKYDGRPNGLKIGSDGGIFVADAEHGILRFDPRTGEQTMRLAEHEGNKLLGPNDLTFARSGELYFTDPGASDLRRPDGRVFRLRADGTTEIVMTGLT